MRSLSGWGRYPIVQNEVMIPQNRAQLVEAVQQARQHQIGPFIGRGLGRSYGDSSLAGPSSGAQVLELPALNGLIAFDNTTGILTAEAGISLAELIRVFLPQGWFVPVTPGTKWVTLGGAVASDVHGKNHHHAGSFGDHVLALDLLLGTGEVVTVGRGEHPELFAATIGGMGLTGIILTVTVQLSRMRSSNVQQRTINAPHLDAVLEGFQEHAAAPYSVAWLDTMATGAHLGRSLLMVGTEADDGVLQHAGDAKLTVPFALDHRVLNPLTVKSFNWLYYHKALRPEQSQTVNYDQYFYQLDGVRNWNLIYGGTGFVQYQCVLPQQGGAEALREVLAAVSESRLSSPITVLKQFGAGNQSPLSFPMAGYTLAVDFAAIPASFALMERLDAMVRAASGRLYLTKDARMSVDFFRHSYPRWQEFQQVREQYGALGIFRSAQSERLGLE